MHWYSRRTYTHMVILTVGILNFVNSYNFFFFCISWWFLWCLQCTHVMCNNKFIFDHDISFAFRPVHYIDITMSVMVSQITSLAIVCSGVYSGAYQRKHQSSTSLAFVWRIHQWLVNSPHKGPVTRKVVPFDDVIMFQIQWCSREAGNCQGLVSI